MARLGLLTSNKEETEERGVVGVEAEEVRTGVGRVLTDLDEERVLGVFLGRWGARKPRSC